MKLVYTGSIFDLGGWHFTSGKTYDVHLYEKSVHYVISDNDKRYYISNEKVKDLGWKIEKKFLEGLNELI